MDGEEADGLRHVDEWGIQDRYREAGGTWRDVPEQTVWTIRDRMGAPPEDGAPPVRVVPEGIRISWGPGTLRLEDGTEWPADSDRPAELPVGYHRLHRPDGSTTLLLVAPPACPGPPDPMWGWAVQVYAARSRESWGIGDLADVRRLARWAHGTGAGTLLLSPLGADTPVSPLEASPYYPSSRRFRHPLYLAVEEVPGAERLGEELERIAAAGRELNGVRRIDRDAAWRLKREALTQIWSLTREGGGDGMKAFARWRRERGRSLEEFTVYCAISEIHGREWRGWPEGLRRPDAGGIRDFAEARRDRVDFHAWLQWLLSRQLRAASDSVPLMQDLPIGVEPGGADAWAWQDLLAEGVSVGAPPDAFNPRGQDWGLPPFIPWRLRSAGYAPFIETLRALLAHGSWARIDHVMGLFRLFWIPRGGFPGEGAYVRYPYEELLAILAIESRRAGAVVVGEDLGTVEEGVRETLARRNVLSYRLLWFEEARPEEWPQNAMAAVTTHDLPTVAGIWCRSEAGAQREAGIEPAEGTLESMRQCLVEASGLGEDAAVGSAIESVYRALSRARSRIVSATLEDAMGVRERPNMPGVSGWPSWEIALPRPIESLEDDPLAASIAEALGERSGG